MSRFTKISQNHLPTLRANLHCYSHPNGARHVHLENEQDELAFVVGFPTMPLTSDGRAHVLEHLVLCGSERYPVANPFFAMLSRSTALFTNAMTYADRTLYPFATTDPRDFFNLLDVYLDATFFPRLDYLSFRQEGWRYEVDGKKLAFQGVVFNEMKGTLSDPFKIVHREIFARLFEKTTYGFDSGGDPLKIIDLTHAELVQFHAEHYHPSQAVFLTSGRIDIPALHSKLEEQVIAKRQGRASTETLRLPPEMRAPCDISIKVPTQGDGKRDHWVQFAWRLGERSDQLARYRWMLFGHAMFGNASSLGTKSLESSGLGRPSRLLGLDDGASHLVFHMGIQGLAANEVAPATDLLWSTLKQAASAEVPLEDLRSGIRDYRLWQREVKGGSIPDGLGRLLAAAPTVMYGEDVISAFDNEGVLEKLESEVSRGGFVSRLAKELLDSPRLAIAQIAPEKAFAAGHIAIESALLRERAQDMAPSEFDAAATESLSIAAHRQARSDNSVLPKLRPCDLSQEPRKLPVPFVKTPELSVYKVASNQIAYGTLLFDLSAFSASDWPWLALYSDFLFDLGVDGASYEEASAWRDRLVPSAGSSIDAVEEGAQLRLVPRLAVFARHLANESAKLIDVVEAWALRPRFDELSRIDFLLKTWLETWVSGLAESTRQYAEWNASAAFSPSRRFLHIARGLGSLDFVRELRSRSKCGEGAAYVAAQFCRLHALLRDSPKRVLWAAPDLEAAFAEQLGKRTEVRSQIGVGSARPSAVGRANDALRVASQVNHCYAVWPAPPLEHEQAAPLAVAAEILRHKILHRRLREEGGAYGGAASYSPHDRVFVMNSYRDPRLAATYDDMLASIDELLSPSYAAGAVEEAIVAVVKGLDRSLPPAAQAYEADRLARRGVTHETRREFRLRVLQVTNDEVSVATKIWLKGVVPSRSAAVGNTFEDVAGMHLIDVAKLVD